MIRPDGTRWEGEKRENKWYGKITEYIADDSMDNFVYENDYIISNKEITDKNDSFYLESVPHKALAPDWSKFV